MKASEKYQSDNTWRDIRGISWNEQQQDTSNELASLITQTVETYFTVRELWAKVIDKGQEEGFTEKELQDMVRPLLKDMLTRHQIRYLFHRKEMKGASKKQYDNLPYYEKLVC